MNQYKVIKLDDLQWKVIKEGTSEKGKPVEKLIGYYPKIELALEALWQAAVRDGVEKELPLNVEEIQALMWEAEKIVKGFKE